MRQPCYPKSGKISCWPADPSGLDYTCVKSGKISCWPAGPSGLDYTVCARCENGHLGGHGDDPEEAFLADGRCTRLCLLLLLYTIIDNVINAIRQLSVMAQS